MATAADIAARLKGDNRTLVGSKDPDGSGFFAASDVGPEGSTHGLANASTASAAAYSANLSADENISVTVVEGDGGLTKNDLRTQYFHTGNYDATAAGFGAKRCFVNSTGQPLDANGVPTTVAAAINAETTDLTALGEAVTNWAQVNKPDGQRSPAPGTYTVHSNATSQYVPHVGWVVEQVSYPIA